MITITNSSVLDKIIHLERQIGYLRNHLGGAPGGSDGQVQYNNSGVFGGLDYGTLGQVLTSAGNGNPPTWEDVVSGSGWGTTGTVATLTGDATLNQGGHSFSFIADAGVFVKTSVTAGGTYNTDNDPILVISRTTALATSSNAHSFVDATIFQRTTDALANNAFTDNGQTIGSAAYNHHAAFQNAYVFNGSVSLVNLYGYIDVPTTNSGTIGSRYGVKINDIAGSGTVTSNYGVYVSPLSRGSGSNYGLYIENNVSYFGGEAQFFTSPSIRNTSGSAGTFATLNYYHGSPSAVLCSKIQSELESGYSNIILSPIGNSFNTFYNALVVTGNGAGRVGVNGTPTVAFEVFGVTNGLDAKFDDANNRVSIDNSAHTAKFSANGSDGVGTAGTPVTFTSQDGKTVTVIGGIITSVV